MSKIVKPQIFKTHILKKYYTLCYDYRYSEYQIVHLLAEEFNRSVTTIYQFIKDEKVNIKKQFEDDLEMERIYLVKNIKQTIVGCDNSLSKIKALELLAKMLGFIQNTSPQLPNHHAIADNNVTRIYEVCIDVESEEIKTEDK